MTKSIGYAALSPTDRLAPFQFERRQVGPHDVQIDILYCGVCHSDLHTARNEWNNTLYPSVPGHEIVGRVAAVGAHVSKFKVGDLAGVGCMVDSCRHCSSCEEGLEQYCDTGFTGTYNGPVFGGDNTYGGYSDKIVVSEQFVLRITHQENLAAVAPLLCAGITTDSPLRQWKVGPGQKVGVAGLGGLGHMAVKIARAMGAHVVLFTTSPDKKADALRLGANEVVISKDPDEMSTHANSFDFILNCIAAPHTPCRGSPMWLMARRSLRCDRHAPAASLFFFLSSASTPSLMSLDADFTRLYSSASRLSGSFGPVQSTARSAMATVLSKSGQGIELHRRATAPTAWRC